MQLPNIYLLTLAIPRTDVPEILARSIFCFLSQIDNVNQLLRGVAYLQVSPILQE